MKDIVLRSPRHAVRRISSAGSRDRSVASHDFGNFDLVKQRAHGSHLDLLFLPERPRVANCNVVLDARADIAVYKVEDMEIFVVLKGAEAYLECRNREDGKLNLPRVSITWIYVCFGQQSTSLFRQWDCTPYSKTHQTHEPRNGATRYKYTAGVDKRP